MPTRMPAQSPTLTDENIGRIKSNAEPVVNLDFQVPSEEYNQFRQEFIACCDAVRSLAAAGATGTLQNVYNNGVASPSVIVVDTMRGAVAVQDSSPTQGTYVLKTLAPNGALCSGFGTNIAKVAATPAGAGGPLGFLIDTNPYITMAGYLCPASDRTMGVGVPGKRMGSIAAGIISGYARVMAYTATPTFDASTATVFDMTLTGNLSSIAFTNVSEGQVIHVIFRQDATGGRQYVGGSVVAIKLRNGETMFQLSSTPSAVDVFTFVGNTSGGVTAPDVIEIARRIEDPIEKRSITIDLLTSADPLELYPHLNMSYVTAIQNSGMVTNKAVNIHGAGYARNGDTARFLFVSMSTGGHTFTIQIEGVDVLTYTAGKNLNGIIEFVFYAGAWLAFDKTLTVT